MTTPAAEKDVFLAKLKDWEKSEQAWLERFGTFYSEDKIHDNRKIRFTGLCKDLECTNPPIDPTTRLWFLDLSGSDLSNMNLSMVTFGRSGRSGFSLAGANLSGTDFTKTSFLKTDLSNADLSGTNLSGAKLRLARGLETVTQYEGVRIDRETTLPSNQPDWLQDLRKAAITSGAAFATWENGQAVAYDANGNKIESTPNPNGKPDGAAPANQKEHQV